ncbi:MAG: PAS domain S-box protein [Acidaminobacter sp.]|uniref:sigma-54 interaction domain-containing protein n=1 Tax=Acidaminobacter sp. TaxID=1872102 RepID=UPI001383DE34|nr:sigma 54-interacting transcriptional regulator [Acidaminobacter sp.]MZQ99407.1 PAS domain S-box protein [Acidaminobacter sp.]
MGFKYLADCRSMVDVINTLLEEHQLNVKFRFQRSLEDPKTQTSNNSKKNTKATFKKKGDLDRLSESEDCVLVSHKIDSKEKLDIYNPDGFLIGALLIESDSVMPSANEFTLTDEIIRILESSYDGLWITDGKGKVLYTNLANERLTGIKREDVVGKMTHELINQKLFSVSATLAVMNEHKRVTIMGYNYKTNKQVLITGNPIFNNDGELAFIVNNVRDITEFDNLRKELNDKDKIIDQQKIEIEKLKNSKKSMNRGYIFRSGIMSEIFELTQRVGRFDLNVLILGESGSGKEVVADSIVDASDRRDKPFIKVNCGAIPESLLESELFGYEKGAFTGAHQKGKIGMFELANGGTILLDEVADIPLNLQVKLLRAIQGKEIMRLGGSKTIKLDVRIIAATNKNLEEMAREGLFREDLFYRLNVVGITVPPLRERREDIPVLIHHFLKKFADKHKVEKSIETDLTDFLCNYSWPGNVRELENLIENLVVLTREPVIRKMHLPERMLRNTSEGYPIIDLHGIMPLKEAVGILEDKLIEMAMHEYGTTRKAAQALGVDQSTIVRKLNKQT